QTEAYGILHSLRAHVARVGGNAEWKRISSTRGIFLCGAVQRGIAYRQNGNFHVVADGVFKRLDDDRRSRGVVHARRSENFVVPEKRLRRDAADGRERPRNTLTRRDHSDGR